MDYDDNDFQSQNRQLAGEGSNKFPPVLQPYALPKFDFDDNIHGSLRFDSLVETDVYLGIESNEDTQWIEDFSRGSGGIQFASSAAESCSIPLRNNVWSEATSSESVEMLLKSVGQEEANLAQIRTEESDACDELGCIMKQMEPNLKQDSNIAATVEDVTNVQAALPPVQFPEESSLIDDGGRQLSSIEDISRGVTSGEKGLSDLPATSVYVGSPITERSPFIDKCDKNGTNEMKVDNFVNDSLDNMIQETSASGTDVCNLVSTGQNTIQGTDGTDKKDSLHNKIETAEEELDISGTDKGEHQKDAAEWAETDFHDSNVKIIESGVSHADDPLCISPRESLGEKSAIQSNYCSTGEPCITPEENLGIEICNQSSIDTQEASLVVVEDDSTDHRHEAEGSKGSHLDEDIVIQVVPSSACIGDDKGTEVKVNGKLSYGAAKCSSSESCKETNAELHVPSSVLVENMQDVTGLHNVTDLDKFASFEQKENTALSSVDGDSGGIHDAGVHVVSFGEGSKVEQAVSKSEPVFTGGNESENVVSLPSGDDINKSDMVEASPLSAVLTCSDTEKEKSMKTSVEASLSDLEAAPEAATGANSVSESDKGSVIAVEQMQGKPDSQLVVVGSDARNQIDLHSLLIGKVSEGIIDKVATPPICNSIADMGESVKEQMKGIGNDGKEEHVNVSDPTLDFEMPASVPSTTVESLHDSDVHVQKVVTASKDIQDEKVAVPCTDVKGISDLNKPASGSPTIIRSAPSYGERNKDGIRIISNPTGSVSEAKVQTASTHPIRTDPSKDDGSFSFQVTPLSVSPKKKSRKRASTTVETSKEMPIVDPSVSSAVGHLDQKVAPDLSHGSPNIAGVAAVLSGVKSNTERKARRSSGKTLAKESAKKRNAARETASGKSDRGEKITGVSLGPSGVSQPVQSNEIQRGNLDSHFSKPFLLATSTAGLPDLNSSISQAAVFHQPFTDLQQVQLRAQIFVYGALIQGTAPDEAHMISAFGGPDGGRSMWESSWRSCVERLHGHNSHLNTPETPLPSRSGARPPEPSIKHSAVQSIVVSSLIGQGSSKSTAIASPIVPFSSPLWTMPTPGGTLQPSSTPRTPLVDYQRLPLSPFHAHLTPGIRNFVGHSPSWLSQAPYGPAWVASQGSTLDASGRFSMQLPVAETVQPTPVKETSVHHSSSMRPTGTPAQIAGSPVFPASSPMLSATMVTASGSQPLTDTKPRKRKKNSIPDNTVQNALPPQPLTESVVANPFSTSVAFSTPVGFVSKVPAEKLVTSVTPLPPDFVRGSQTSEQKAMLSEETLGMVKDAKVQAEDAAASAASAVSHSEQVWDQLEKQKTAGLLPDAETKLASATVAIAAAAAVAKAAAAAAKVASNAALQAKLIAEEAVASTNISQVHASSIPDGMQNLAKATPASILKGDRTNSSTSAIVVVREAARKKVEAASAAAKRAENMDAIVKAAELAAEAVSQAGKIVAMGDPMPLSELVAAGPEGYWKATSPELIARSNDADRENRNIYNGKEGPRQLKEVPSEKKEIHIASHGKPPTPRERFSGDQDRLMEGSPSSGVIMIKEPRVVKGWGTSDLAKTIGVVPESENGSRASIAQNKPEKEEISKENNIKEHSLVEVYKDGYGLKAAWFPAKVISLKDGEAYVEFTELALGEGSEKLREWMPLKGNGDQAPKIRIARPTNIIPSEGTRKRRRAAMVDHVWSVGDRVDVWIEDSWREGVVTEKDKKDESLITVNFPARGEILVIPSALLHPSRIWKDGAWVEWSSSGDNSRPSHGGDTPKQKRPRVRSPLAVAKGKDKASANVDAAESDKLDDLTLLVLSTHEQEFNIGKSSRDDTVRVPRRGLQKEGPRVVFGVPKPGKKRKFMEVSKHYVSNRSVQTSEAKEPLKFTKYLMPQGTGSRSWRSSKSETNEKEAAIPKPKVPKSRSVFGRTVSQKDNADSGETTSDKRNRSSKSETNEKEAAIPKPKVPKSRSVFGRTVSQKDNADSGETTSDKRNAMAFGGASEGPMSSSAQSDAVSSKRGPTTNAKPERSSKGRLAPAFARLPKIEEGKTSNGTSSDSVEPRRSVRRIQPTSRLLEGLQSSLMVAKIPSISHDKSHRRKNTSRGH